jgi:hypothetical protein
MSTDVVLASITALTAVVGSILSVLLLAYRVGRVTGTYEERLRATDKEVGQNTAEIGKLRDMLSRHISIPHPRK